LKWHWAQTVEPTKVGAAGDALEVEEALGGVGVETAPCGAWAATHVTPTVAHNPPRTSTRMVTTPVP
jgi:hypothetical protein